MNAKELELKLSDALQREDVLKKQLAESQREFRAADATIENLQMQLNAEREAKLALAAESAGLKNAFGPGDAVLNFLTIALRHTTYDQIDLDDVTLAFKMSLPETPATDAFLAEVSASGVDMFAAVLRRKGDDAFFDAIAEDQANAADQFASQLRKGAQS